MTATKERPIAGTWVYADLNDLGPNPWQLSAERRFAPDLIRRLADSIRDIGLQQYPVARQANMLADKPLQLAFGHRRVEAIRLLMKEGAWRFPGVPIEIKDLPDSAMAIIALVENTDREQITPIEETRAIQKMLAEVKDLTIEAVAKSLGKDRSTLSNQLRVLNLPQVVLDRVNSGELSFHGAREFLCLVSMDKDEVHHAHTEHMGAVIGEIVAVRLGAGGPDWRAANIRRLIRDAVTGQRVSEWRKLEVTAGQVIGGTHWAYDPDFQIAEFKAAHPLAVHNIPAESGRDEPERRMAWTCNTAAWKKAQDAAKAKATHTKGKPKVSAKDAVSDKVLHEALSRDPLAKSLSTGKAPVQAIVAGVVAKVIEEGQHAPEDVRAAVGPPAPTGISEEDMDEADAELEDQELDEAAGVAPAAPVVAAGTHDAVGEAYAKKLLRGQGFRLLTEHLGERCKEVVADSKALDSLRRSGMVLQDALKLGKYGLTMAETVAATGGFVDRFEERMVLEAQKKVDPDDLRKALGTRGEPVVNVGFTKGFHQSLQQHDKPPAYFPDIKECLETCTWGARFGVSYPGDSPRLYCFNKEHYDEKLAKGLLAYKAKRADDIAAYNAREAEMVKLFKGYLNDALGGLHVGPTLARSIMLAASQWQFTPLGYGDVSWEDKARFGFNSNALFRMGHLVDAKPEKGRVPENAPTVLTREALRAGAAVVTDAEALEAAANLLGYVFTANNWPIPTSPPAKAKGKKATKSTPGHRRTQTEQEQARAQKAADEEIGKAAAAGRKKGKGKAKKDKAEPEPEMKYPTVDDNAESADLPLTLELSELETTHQLGARYVHVKPEWVERIVTECDDDEPDGVQTAIIQFKDALVEGEHGEAFEELEVTLASARSAAADLLEGDAPDGDE